MRTGIFVAGRNRRNARSYAATSATLKADAAIIKP
jgi:hypothetical protein